MRADREREFAEYVEARIAVLRRLAYLLCSDWDRAEELVQSTLTKIYVAWPRLRREDTLDAHARQVLARAAIAAPRRGLWRRKPSAVKQPEVAEQSASFEDIKEVRAALAALSAVQRAVVVLRFWENLPLAETARLLGCSQDAVQHQSDDGLAALRPLLAADPAVFKEQR